MDEKSCIVSRMTAIVAVLTAALMLGVPSFIIGGDSPLSAVGSAEAQGIDVDRTFILGVTELTVDSLNPNTYTMVSEGLAIFYCYSYLLGYDVNTQVIGDLANSWSFSPDGLTWNFKLANNAYFCDPAFPLDKSHPVTAEDVIFTFWALQNNTNSRLHSYFPDVIESMWYTDPYDLWIQLNKPHAPILESFLGAMILPKYYWESEDFINFDNTPPIGSGAFYYATLGIPTTGSVELRRNPIWFQTENKGWQIHTDAWIIKEELSPDIALLDLNSGDIDCMLRVSPSLFLDTLPTYSNVIGFSQSAGFVYEFNLNQMTDELRAELKGSFMAGTNNQLLLNPAVKEAIAMCLDKQAFVDDIMMGLGSVADSLVPPANPGHYDIPDPVPYDPVAARNMLRAAGWDYDATGALATSTTCPLYRLDENNLAVDPLSFRFYTLDTSVDWYNGAMKIKTWAAAIGVFLDLEIHSVSEMNTIWYAADYDLWLWDWIFSVLTDASSILEVLTSYSIGSSSDVYWVDETYDALYDLSLVTVDPAARLEILNTMQQMAYDNFGCQCVAYSNDNYGVSTITWNSDSLGDWNNTYMLLPDIWAQWLSQQMYPNENHAPQFTSYTGSSGTVDAEVGVSENFLATALDDDPTTPLVYRWFWGDGTRTDWSSSGAASHTYAADGLYEVWLAVREAGASNGFDDNFTTSAMINVAAYDMSNQAPTGVSFTYDPTDPDAGTFVTFTGTATDPNSDPLYYTWNFGDGHSTEGQVVEHQFGAEGSFTVTLSVTDNHLGQGSRPVTYSELVYVANNNAPTISVPDFPDIPIRQTEIYTVTASDPENSMRFTWDWGDGSISVTAVPTESHSYSNRGTFTLTVWADDLTGLPGHNTSDSGTVYVYNPSANKKPTDLLLSVDDNTPYTGQVVTFSASASDPDGDPLKFTIAFGDGTYYVESFGGTAEGEVVSLIAEKSYATAGSPTAFLYVSDGIDNVTSNSVVLTVTLNFAPTLSALSDVYGVPGTPINVVADVYDLDDDPLVYTWVWGDGSVSVTSVESASHTYIVGDNYAYRVYVDDGHEHNVTDAAFAYINTVPVLEPLVDVSLDVGEVHTFEATASDADPNDVLSYMWDFGDGTGFEFGPAVEHLYTAEGSYDFAVWVDDAFALIGHNISSTATAIVTAADVEGPVADAGPDQSVMAGELVTLDGSGSTDNIGIVNWTWTFTWNSESVELWGEFADCVFDAEPATVDVTLTVRDAAGNSDTDSMVVYITGWIPEFSALLLPVAGTIVMLGALVYVRRRKQ